MPRTAAGAALLIALALLPTTPAGAAPNVTVVTHPQKAAFSPSWAGGAQAQAAPDPAVVRFGTTYYAYTTGTSWGNHIGILRSSTPTKGFRTITGRSYGSSAFPSVPYTQPIRPWQRTGTQNAPGVYRYDGRYIMFYTAQTVAGHGGHYCVSRATASKPSGPFVDRSTKPWVCMDKWGGVIDPQPFVDARGRAWLYVKTYDLIERGPQPSRIWAIRLGRNGVKRIASPVPILSQSAMSSPYETVENPQMLRIGSTHVLLYSRGNWNTSNYRQGIAICSGPSGGCHEANAAFLRSYGNVLGPGGGTIFRDPSGRRFIAYHAWRGAGACVGDRATCARKLFVARVKFS
jgi:beta-xylosidase